mmetsp:Transcript_31214/g.72450  ORF Transcript_31214/g.72450 Transcript_31214/m.72450 type:complete len:230 (+) Transcript_31214:121-810(+)
MEIEFVKPSGEAVATLTCKPSDTALSLRCRLSEAACIPLPLLRLVWRNDVLADVATLDSQGITGKEPILLVHESAARLSLLPGFQGLYRGEEHEEGNGRGVYEMVLDSLDFSELPGDEVEGVIHWRCLQNPQEVKVGMRARELVSGTVSESGDIHLRGYEEEQKFPLIALCHYELKLADNGSEIRGTFQDNAGGQVNQSVGEFVLHRLSESEAELWREEREADPWGWCT